MVIQPFSLNPFSISSQLCINITNLMYSILQCYTSDNPIFLFKQLNINFQIILYISHYPHNVAMRPNTSLQIYNLQLRLFFFPNKLQ
ncbi:hypothetical protein pb186bvf_018523 [Paramecium bursaria]